MWDLASPQEALGFKKFANIQKTFLKHPAKKPYFPLEGGYGRKLIFLSSGGAAVCLHNIHVAPLDAGDPIQYYITPTGNDPRRGGNRSCPIVSRIGQWNPLHPRRGGNSS